VPRYAGLMPSLDGLLSSLQNLLHYFSDVYDAP